MSVAAAAGLFAGSLALSVVSSYVLADLLEKVGNRYKLSEGLVGILTAVGADSPEIAAAVTALQTGRSDLGVGIVLGSNLYNIAALLGLSAVVAGSVKIRRRALLLQGTVAFAVTIVGVLLVLRALSPVISVVFVLVVLSPYVALSSISAPHCADPFPTEEPPGARKALRALRRYLLDAAADQAKDVRSGQTPAAASKFDLLATIPVLVSVVLASIGLVKSAQTIADRYRISDVILGTLVLAILTGIPNVIASVRLARRGRGSAVISEGLNSNSINVVVGLCLPALVVGLGQRTHTAILESCWLTASTALAVGLTFFRGGLLRWEGAVVIVTYLCFVAVLVLTL